MKWVLVESDNSVVAELSVKAGLYPLIARLMVNRGITDAAAAVSFLSCDMSGLSDPGIFSDMEKAVSRVRKAVSGREKIVVYGDYDVDGVTGASLLFLVLKDLGADAGCYIPDRMTEGYGLNCDALNKIKASGVGLVITVDCGISAVKEAELARSIGLDLIITDHHELSNPKSESINSKEAEHTLEFRNSDLGFVLPDAYACLHPALISAGASVRTSEDVRGLTGVGIAFKLAQALMDADADDERLRRCLDLVTLGTIADMGRITGENRTLVRHGLDMLSAEGAALRPGVSALKQVAGLNGKRVGVGNVGFALAPRINASGRLESADTAFRLLTTESREEAAELASMLDAVNRERQSIEEGIWEEARQMCRRMDMAGAGAIVLSSPDWHPGVIGIVASRIAEEFYRPTTLISLQEGIGKGSARSIPGFDLYHGLAECSDLLMGFGGHKYAAGLTIAEDRIRQLRERLSAISLERMAGQGFTRTLMVDGSAALGDFTMEFMREMEKLAPFGQGNPEPRLGARNLEVVSPKVVGNNHLKLRLRQQSGVPFNAIAFNKGHLLGKIVKDGSRIAAVFTPRLNTWNGTTSIELEIRDVKVEK